MLIGATLGPGIRALAAHFEQALRATASGVDATATQLRGTSQGYRDAEAMTSAPYVSPVKNRMGDVWAQSSPQLTDVKTLYTGGFALDVLGDIGDPLGAVIGCAVGWIVDHVDFLREPVDWLAGNPRSIEASISTWGQTWVPMRAVGCRMSR